MATAACTGAAPAYEMLPEEAARNGRDPDERGRCCVDFHINDHILHITDIYIYILP